jgi:phosphoglucomutase
MNLEWVYQTWLNNENLDADMKKQLEKMAIEEREDAFYKSLEFGTAGMRGIIGPGTNRMNIYTIRKANVGFANYLIENVSDAKERGVAIAYDNRHFSPEFAMESAKVLATHGIKTYVFDGPRPTPELSFAVRYLNAAGGIVITASHNPPEYNGYKIYDESGCQILPTEGDKVIAGVNVVRDVFDIHVKLEDELRATGLIETIGYAIDDAYLARVKGLEINTDVNKRGLKVVFSPLHGTAGMLTSKLLADCGYTGVQMVAEQAFPNPDFPTVKYPNPEETSAFAMAIDLGEKINADVLLATDPDADRMGVAAKDESGAYVFLTGNQTGAVMVHYILSQRKARRELPAKGRVFDTIVSSEMAAKIARSYGMQTMSTLTGFKFIGEQARLMEDTEYEYVFGYEESYGSLVGDFVRDKDAIQAVLILVEAAAYYKEQGKTLCDVLNELYEQFGFYQEDLANISLVGKEGAEKIQSILADFRNTPPTEVAQLKVATILDYKTSKRINVMAGTVSKIDLPAANVLKYILEDGSWFVIRPSGTEPKAKVYISVVTGSKNATALRVSEIKKAVLARIDEVLVNQK